MKVLMLIVALIWLPFTNSPQTKFQFANNSKISVAGTSTLHDWTMDTRTVKGEVDLEMTAGTIVAINQLKVEIPIESLKSGKSAMDKNAYEALKAKNYPNIYFQVKSFDQIKSTTGASALEVTGNLTIAGKTRPEKIQLQYKTDKTGNLLVSGAKAIKMTDYGVTPPEVMMGTIKTGNDITINFELNLNQINTLQ